MRSSRPSSVVRVRTARPPVSCSSLAVNLGACPSSRSTRVDRFWTCAAARRGHAAHRTRANASPSSAGTAPGSPRCSGSWRRAGARRRSGVDASRACGPPGSSRTSTLSTTQSVFDVVAEGSASCASLVTRLPSRRGRGRGCARHRRRSPSSAGCSTSWTSAMDGGSSSGSSP